MINSLFNEVFIFQEILVDLKRGMYEGPLSAGFDVTAAQKLKSGTVVQH